MRFIIKASCYSFFLLSFGSACSKEDLDCGCDGSTSRTFENVQARYVGEGVFVVPDSIAGFLRLYPCELDTTWEISKEENTWNYRIFANLKKHCFGPNPELELPYEGGKIELTDIKKL